MKILLASGARISELTGVHGQATAVTPEMYFDWLGYRDERFEVRYLVMAHALWLRYSYEIRLTFPEIACLLGCRSNYVQDVIQAGRQRLMKYPHYDQVEKEKDHLIVAGTQLYADLFGCDLGCCATEDWPQAL